MKTSLQKVIDQLGDEAAADLFGTEPAATRSWRLRYRYPRREKAKEIINILAKHPLGPMTWEGVYGD